MRTLLVLLHRRANSPQVTGFYERGFPGEPSDATLRYRVVRVWEVPAREWLAGGLGLVPLAPLGDVGQADLPAVGAQMKQRFEREKPRQIAELWSATYILMGLRYQDALIQTLLRGVMRLEESVTYQAILRKGEAKGEARGRAAEARRMLLVVGQARFGKPSAKVVAALEALSDLDELEQLGIRLLQAGSWGELLGWNGAEDRCRGRKKSS